MDEDISPGSRYSCRGSKDLPYVPNTSGTHYTLSQFTPCIILMDDVS